MPEHGRTLKTSSLYFTPLEAKSRSSCTLPSAPPTHTSLVSCSLYLRPVGRSAGVTEVNDDIVPDWYQSLLEGGQYQEWRVPLCFGVDFFIYYRVCCAMYQSIIHSIRYDKLLSAVKSSGRGAPPPGMCVVGMSVMGEEVMRGVLGEYEKGQVTGGGHVVVSK